MIVLLIALAWLLASLAFVRWITKPRTPPANDPSRPRTFRAQDDHRVERPDVPRKGLR